MELLKNQSTVHVMTMYHSCCVLVAGVRGIYALYYASSALCAIAYSGVTLILRF